MSPKESVRTIICLPFYPEHIESSDAVIEWCKKMMEAICKEHLSRNPKTGGEEKPPTASLQSTFVYPGKTEGDESPTGWIEGCLKITRDKSNGIFSGHIFLSSEEERKGTSFGRIEMIFNQERRSISTGKKNLCLLA